MKHTNTHLLRMRRALCLILCLALCLPLSACAASPFDFSIEETLLYDRHDIKITATKNISKDHFEVALVLDNWSDKDYDITVHYMAINGIMARFNPYSLKTSVPSGAKADAALLLDRAWFTENKIQDIRSIDVLFLITDQKENGERFDADVTHLKTNHFKEGEEITAISGTKTFEGKGIADLSVYSLGATKFLVKNNDDEYYFQYTLKDFTLNDSPYIYQTDVRDQMVFPNCVSIFDANPDESALKGNYVDKINKMKFHFEIVPFGMKQHTTPTDDITVTLDENGAPLQ